MDFFNQTGKMAIGSRLRMLTDLITENASQIYRLYDVDLKAKWFPVFFVLSAGESKTITAIAKEIGHSHPSVSNIIKEMVAKGLVKELKDKTDGRRNVVGLSAKGKLVAEKLTEQYVDVTAAIDSISCQTKNDLWKAIEEWEFLLSEKSLLKRVEEEKKARESKYVQIISYTPHYQQIFRSLNEQWIKSYFEMEEADYKALDNPEEYILKNGGYIFIALYKDQPVGACALLKMKDEHYDYELAKMAVSPNAQGKNIGFLLGRAAINKAIELGASNVYLESNTILKPAINLYQKLGFKKVVGHSTPYKRCNIQMELTLK
ncbi:bifunctional helix-turn-helix transcriptional regulator/GNAT family N-acetyltransferase [Prevotella sp. 10(H)]|uniref:bifunctional helix-turn-helix transcriptional regulator/GNAT family N-acetyltransferase n=1 Tax=Prevotella sp. 10(H) TaxID=1158294 RepID=UPI0004A6C698|nr:bifunctional helix-turn-helix transcriptional regulator/GNAT family N-acetyltransferase [Prevotella sp. 10(H)]